MSDKLTKQWNERKQNPFPKTITLEEGECTDFYSIDETKKKGCQYCAKSHMCKQKPNLGFSPIHRCLKCENEMSLVDSFGVNDLAGGKALVQFWVCWECKIGRRHIY